MKKRLPRFGLRTLFLVLTAWAIVLGIGARRTDPDEARKGMSKLEVWWQCGPPDAASKTDILWQYTALVDGHTWCRIDVRFDQGRVVMVSFVPFSGPIGQPGALPQNNWQGGGPRSRNFPPSQ